MRGVFISAGVLAAPEKGYHAEIVCTSAELSSKILQIMEVFGLSPKQATRKKNRVVYIKESEQISDFLKVIGATDALMSFENTRVQKDINNQINRQANAGAANFDKTVNASVKQVLDIEYIKSARGLEFLQKPLREVAELRLLHTEANLAELGTRLVPPVSKSCVNHRLRKIGSIADRLRGKHI
ncbi:hypothetical protein FACS1894188_00090 [Clostridia bacterium]|nr:hypothetical protein FACS1894188_00090 [Clostridia bacterium]